MTWPLNRDQGIVLSPDSWDNAVVLVLVVHIVVMLPWIPESHEVVKTHTCQHYAARI